MQPIIVIDFECFVILTYTAALHGHTVHIQTKVATLALLLGILPLACRYGLIVSH